MRILEVTADDHDLAGLVAAQVRELSIRYHGVPDEGPQPPLDPAAVFLLVRDEDGAAVACGAIQPLAHTMPGAPADAGEVKRVYVEPAHRGRGVARLIMAELHARGYARGFRRLWLEAGTVQPEALGLYRALGYSEIGPYGYFKDSPRTVSFERILTVADAHAAPTGF